MGKRLMSAVLAWVVLASQAWGQTCAPTEIRGSLSADGTKREGLFSTTQANWLQDKRNFEGDGWTVHYAANLAIHASCKVPTPQPPAPRPPQPVDCVVGPYSACQPASEWGACTEGTQTRTETRTVTQSRTVTPTPTPAPTPGVTFLFRNGWENRTDLGAGSIPTLLDGPGGRSATWWNDFGPAFLSQQPYRAAEIVNQIGPYGTTSRMLQVNFAPDGSQNGPDFRIGQDVGNRPELYARWWVKYSPNWVWASADHKSMICGEMNGGQNIYYNIRGNGNGGKGRVVIHVIPADTLFEDANTDVSPGVWHLMELHIVAGTHGKVEAKLDGRLLRLRNDPGLNPNDINTGPSVGYCKIDTTYNAYSYPSRLKLTMQTWFDNVAMATGGWIGGQ